MGEKWTIIYLFELTYLRSLALKKNCLIFNLKCLTFTLALALLLHFFYKMGDAENLRQAAVPVEVGGASRK